MRNAESILLAFLLSGAAFGQAPRPLSVATTIQQGSRGSLVAQGTRLGAPGTPGYLPIWEGTGGLGDSGVAEDSGTVLIGRAPGEDPLDYLGNALWVSAKQGETAIAASSTSAFCIVGTNTSGSGIYGWSQYGIGVYGATQSASNPAGKFDGDVQVTQDLLVFGNIHSAGFTVAGTPAISAETVGGTALYGHAQTASGYAGRFDGRVRVNGDLSVTGAKQFQIDHPLDPENKVLAHACVESSEMKNVYDGVVTLDAEGVAVVELPEWFEALNGDFRYQLTALGAPAPDLHVAEKIAGYRFKVAGGKPHMEVSWQVTGVRHDASAMAHPTVVEETKGAAERGLYLDPAAFGLPAEKGIGFAGRKQLAMTPAKPPK
jgi:hypothetical protein